MSLLLNFSNTLVTDFDHLDEIYLDQVCHENDKCKVCGGSKCNMRKKQGKNLSNWHKHCKSCTNCRIGTQIALFCNLKCSLKLKTQRKCKSPNTKTLSGSISKNKILENTCIGLAYKAEKDKTIFWIDKKDGKLYVAANREQRMENMREKQTYTYDSNV